MNTVYPASDSQSGIWFVSQYATDPTVYNSPVSVPVPAELAKDLDPGLLERALRHVVRRHEALRTTFEMTDGTLMQRIHDEPRVWFRAAEAPTEADLDRITRELARTRFDLGQGPLHRVICVRRGPGDIRLLVNIHHAVFDGSSWQVFLPEWFDAYRALANGQTLDATNDEWQFRDFQDWQRGRLEELGPERVLGYWRDKLGGATPLLALPLDKPRPPVQAFEGAAVSFDLPHESVLERARKAGLTPLMLLLAAYAVFLHKHTGQREVLVGMPATLRDRVETQPVIGHLINTIVLRHEVTPDLRVEELLEQTKAEVLGSTRHKALAFEKVLEAINPERSTGHSPIFQTMVTMVGKGPNEWEHISTGAKYDLSLILEEDGGIFEYDTALFEPDTVETMTRRFRTVVGEIVDKPDACVADLTLLTEAEEQELLAGWRVPVDERVGTEPVSAIFERQAAETPDQTAVEFDGQTLTYAELNQQANQLAQALRNRGARPNTRIGIFLDRSLEMIVGLLGVLKSGAAYVPLDPAYPRDRIEYMLSDSGATLVVTRASLTDHLPDLEVLDIDGLGTEPATDLSANKSADDEIYLTYTSGSTGRPKGVIINDRTIANLTYRQIDISGRNAAARTLQYMSLSFDVSVEEILSTLCAGGTLFVVPEDLRTDLHRLISYVDEHRIERLFLPYIALHQIAGIVTRNENPLPHLAEVYSTGEQLVVTPQLREMFDRFTDARLYNIYGPSESHLCTVHQLAEDPASWPEAPPIGRAVTGVPLLVLDERQRPVPNGVPGELHVGGDILSPGYNGLPEQTEGRFIQDPYAEGARLYRTGDLVKIDRQGEMVYLGRVDEQVKIRGYRIEPAEIESALNELDFVESSAVVAVELGPGDKRLVGYLVTNREAPPAELRKQLGGSLPDYMIPARFVYLDRIPTTPSGKIDRSALLKLELPEGDTIESRELTEDEQRMRTIWARLLDTEQLGPDDDFFGLGGNSILAVELTQAVRDEFGVETELGTLLNAPTIAGMTAQVSSTNPAAEIDLWADTELPADLIVADRPATAPDVLLTGATGFLGIYLLRALLADREEGTDRGKRQQEKTVHCLVRAEDEDDGWARIEETARRYRLADDLDRSRIRVLPGDLTQQRFGLDSTTYDELSERIGVIHHAAAHINFAAPYASVKPTNVDGFTRVLEFAGHKALKPVHYMSTLAVFSPQQSSTVFTETSVPAESRGLGIGYAQSKWVAERLAMAARERGVPVSIYRIGRIGADAETGACRGDDFFWLQVKSFLRLGLAPKDPGPRVDLLPVDFVSAAVTGLADSRPAGNQTWHIFHPDGLAWDCVFETLRGLGHQVDLVRMEDWLDALERRGAEAGELASIVPLFRSGAMRLGDHVYRNQRTGRALAELDLGFPEPDGAWVAAMIDYFRTAGELD